MNLISNAKNTNRILNTHFIWTSLSIATFGQGVGELLALLRPNSSMSNLDVVSGIC